MYLQQHSQKTRELWLGETCRHVDQFVAAHPGADAHEVALLARTAADFMWARLGARASWHTVNRTALAQDAEVHFGDPVFAARLVAVVGRFCTWLRAGAAGPRDQSALHHVSVRRPRLALVAVR